MSKLIKDNVQSLQARIKDYQQRILNWQEKCEHQIIKGEYKGNTGNWDGSNYYWIIAECLDCGKHFNCDSNTEEYHWLSKIGMISSQYDTKEKLVAQELRRIQIENKRSD